MRKLYYTICFLSVSLVLAAQEIKAYQVKGAPSEEIYDLLSDSKGFIWLGHSLGISRYDGISFTTFNHPEATSAGISDLLEDKQGKIWYHNFDGQIFYIDNEQPNLLKAYKYKEESYFPRMIILGDELVCTSEKGLFICNTQTLECRYIYHNVQNTKIRSLAVVKNVLYEFDGEQWICYSKENGVRELSFKREIPSTDQNSFNLQPLVSSDTIYAKCGSNEVYKFIIRNNQVSLIYSKLQNSFINTLSYYEKSIWIHTKNESYSIDGNAKIKALNLTDITIDREGNTWYSSLDKGLWVKPRFIEWESSWVNTILKTDFVRSYAKVNKTHIYGTQNGCLIIKKGLENKDNIVLKLPKEAGSAENFFVLPNNDLLVAPSLGLYLLNSQTGKLYQLSKIATVKGIAFAKDSIYIAYPKSLVAFELSGKTLKMGTFKEKEFVNILRKDLIGEVYLKTNRCYAVCYDSVNNKLFALFKDGLFEVKVPHFLPVSFHCNISNASLLLTLNGKLIIGTPHNGIFIEDNGKETHLTTENGLASNGILKMKLIEGDLFITEAEHMQVFDLEKGVIKETMSLPIERSGLIFDIWKEDGVIFAATNKGLYNSVQTSMSTVSKPVTYLLYAKTNKGFIRENVLLQYADNSLQFKLASPSYYVPENTYFRYRLIGNNDTSWIELPASQPVISFTALKPGDYIFQANVINFQHNTGNMIVFPFHILKPWWQEWRFMLFCMMVFLGLVFYFTYLRLRYIRKKNFQVIEYLKLKNELRKSMLETIKAQMNPHFIFNSLNTIQSFVYTHDKKNASKFIGKFSELVRNILNNSSKQTVTLTKEIEMLVLYLELENLRFEDSLEVEFDINPQMDTDNIRIPAMLIQPYVENAVVHGLFHKKDTKHLSIKIDKMAEDYLEIIIEDNGIGRAKSNMINRHHKGHESFANSANEKRIDLLNQYSGKKIILEITDKVGEQEVGTGTIVRLLIPLTMQES